MLACLMLHSRYALVFRHNSSFFFLSTVCVYRIGIFCIPGEKSQASKQLRDLSATHTGKEDTPDVLEDSLLSTSDSMREIERFGYPYMVWNSKPNLVRPLNHLNISRRKQSP